MLFENHVAYLVSNSCIWMYGGVVEEMDDFCSSLVVRQCCEAMVPRATCMVGSTARV